ncbi:hypothetical protein ACIQI8_43905 [Streptomyces sp. NPDC092369]|uniref:hypothetical protein n=1 Tax=Streptomyces sp. NPDC092369 TaxID=3366015 RepID=UPI003806A09B
MRIELAEAPATIAARTLVAELIRGTPPGDGVLVAFQRTGVGLCQTSRTGAAAAPLMRLLESGSGRHFVTVTIT